MLVYQPFVPVVPVTIILSAVTTGLTVSFFTITLVSATFPALSVTVLFTILLLPSAVTLAGLTTSVFIPDPPASVDAVPLVAVTVDLYQSSTPFVPLNVILPGTGAVLSICVYILSDHSLVLPALSTLLIQNELDTSVV